MSDLIVFLTARLDEDEAAADTVLFACRDSRQPWPPEQAPGRGGPALTAFLRHFSENRMLREVEAKRKIVRRCMAGMDELDVYPNGLLTPRALLSRQTLMDLAAVYSDHPDYWPAAAGKDCER